MRKLWMKLAVTVVTGASLFQTASCADTANGVTAAASVVTAGSVLYLVRRVID